MRRTFLGLGCAFALMGAAQAQVPAKPMTAAPAVDAATLKAAREVVAKMQGDRASVLASMSGPMVAMVQQLGIREPDRAQVLVQDVLIPVMTAHYDELLDVQARSFAGVLGTADLQAVATFYDTPAGRALAKAQPQLAQAQLTGMTQWMGGLVPEIQTKLAQAIKTRGWDKGQGK